jgi:hypothetical protein
MIERRTHGYTVPERKEKLVMIIQTLTKSAKALQENERNIKCIRAKSCFIQTDKYISLENGKSKVSYSSELVDIIDNANRDRKRKKRRII